MARPTKLTPEIQRTICAALQAGNYVEAACGLAGISDTTFYRWMERGDRESRGQFREFRDSVSRAIAASEAGLVAVVYREAKGNWRAALALLSRRWPERWGNKQEIRTPDGQPLIKVYAGFNPEDV